MLSSAHKRLYGAELQLSAILEDQRSERVTIYA